jgi:hypothetical protein
MAVVADRAFTSRATLQRIEQGDPAVGMGIYVAVLHALGLLEGVGQSWPTHRSIPSVRPWPIWPYPSASASNPGRTERP